MRQRARPDSLTICRRKNQINVSFSCVCPLIDNDVKVGVDALGYRVVDP